MIGIIGALLTGGLSLAGDFIKNKGEKKRLEMQNERQRIENQGVVEKAAAEAKAKAMVTRMEGDIAWETIMAKGSLTSWKDEFWTIVLGMPLIVTMVPSAMSVWESPMEAATYVQEGLTAVSAMPEWYQAGIGVAVASAFGFRKVTDFFAKKKGA